MLRKGNDLKGFQLIATDGGIGSLKEFYFEDDTWTVRYLVVDTDSLFNGRPVLISPASVRGIEAGSRTIRVNLTRDQIRRSPPIEKDKPVSRRYEEMFNDYYKIVPYWIGPGIWGGGAFPSMVSAPGLATAPKPAEIEPGDPHLRSSRELRDYTVHARDGDAGIVDDFILEDRTWTIRYVVVDTNSWWPGGKVLVSPRWVDKISWAGNRIHADLARKTIKGAPHYDPAAPITDDYERLLARYYGSEEHLSHQRLKRPAGV